VAANVLNAGSGPSGTLATLNILNGGGGGGGSSNPPGGNPPGGNPPGGNPPGSNPPGTNPPGNNPPGGSPGDGGPTAGDPGNGGSNIANNNGNGGGGGGGGSIAIGGFTSLIAGDGNSDAAANRCVAILREPALYRRSILTQCRKLVDRIRGKQAASAR
jgi:hypothetical protein